MQQRRSAASPRLPQGATMTKNKRRSAATHRGKAAGSQPTGAILTVRRWPRRAVVVGSPPLAAAPPCCEQGQARGQQWRGGNAERKRHRERELPVLLHQGVQHPEQAEPLTARSDPSMGASYYALDCRSCGERLPCARARGLRPSRPGLRHNGGCSRNVLKPDGRYLPGC